MATSKKPPSGQALLAGLVKASQGQVLRLSEKLDLQDARLSRLEGGQDEPGVVARLSKLERSVSVLVTEMQQRGVLPPVSGIRPKRVKLSPEARAKQLQEQAALMRARRWTDTATAAAVPKAAKKRKKKRPA